MADVALILFAIITILGFAYPSPIWFHIVNRNSGPLCLIVWIFVLNIVILVNALIWASNDDEKALVWCDISAKLLLVSPIALASSHFSISLYVLRVFLQETNRRAFGKSDRRLQATWDYSLCFCLPVFIGLVQIFYQNGRFAIAKTVGCQPVVSINVPAFFLYLLVAPVIAAGSALFSTYITYRLIRDRQRVGVLAKPAQSSYSAPWFLRLACLTCVLGPIVFIFSVLVCVDFFNTYGPYESYNWSKVHSTISVIKHFPNVSHANALAVFPVIVGLLCLLILGPGGEVVSFFAKIGRALHVNNFFVVAIDRVSRRLTGASFFGPTREQNHMTMDVDDVDFDSYRKGFDKPTSAPMQQRRLSGIRDTLFSQPSELMGPERHSFQPDATPSKQIKDSPMREPNHVASTILSAYSQPTIIGAKNGFGHHRFESTDSAIVRASVQTPEPVRLRSALRSNLASSVSPFPLQPRNSMAASIDKTHARMGSWDEGSLFDDPSEAEVSVARHTRVTFQTPSISSASASASGGLR